MNTDKFINYGDIQCIQVDPTSRCNLLCPQCSRVERGQLNSKLPLAELEREDYINIFTPSLLKQLDKIVFNGNYGDPVISAGFTFAIEHIFSHGSPFFMAATNGSLRSEKWWKDLGQQLKGHRHMIFFSIDGLKDTNHKYRVNSHFDKIIANAEAFISAGGKARWDFIVFEHNAHQIDEARTLAKKIGFKKFNLKQTFRFNDGEAYRTNRASSHSLVFDKKAKLTGNLKPSGDNKAGTTFNDIVRRYGSWNNYIDKTPIHCKYQQDMKALFVDFMARLWPCTWLAAPIYFYSENNLQTRQLKEIINRYEKDFNSLRKHSLEEILSHPWFQSELTKSWFNRIDDKNFKLMTCGRTCGRDYEFSSGGIWKNSQVVDLP